MIINFMITFRIMLSLNYRCYLMMFCKLRNATLIFQYSDERIKSGPLIPAVTNRHTLRPSLMKYAKNFLCFFSICLLGGFNKTASQKPLVTSPHDSLKNVVEILPGVQKIEFRKIDSLTELQILSGNVRLRQGKTIFSCDSCVINNRMKTFDAFGHVHINDTDTTHIYSEITCGTSPINVLFILTTGETHRWSRSSYNGRTGV